jgi:hypothetical protein
MNVPTQVIVHSVVQNLAVTKHLQQVMVGKPMFAHILGRSPISALRKHVARALRHQVTSRSMFAHIQVHTFSGCDPELYLRIFLCFCELNVIRQVYCREDQEILITKSIS